MSDNAMTVSHQTVRLSRGCHQSPEHGACVMELASMLAGEEFSDHPRSVCPVIGDFLRTYNDALDDERRQDLYVYAAKVVGTRGRRAVQKARRRLCRDFADQAQSRRARAQRRVGLALSPSVEAARAIARDDGGHARALAFLDELIGVGGSAPDRPEPSGVEQLVTA